MMRDRNVPGAAGSTTESRETATDSQDADSAGGGTVGAVDLGALPPDLAASMAVALLRASDQTTAAATVLAGHVAASAGPGGSLVGGVYASPRRWLEAEARLSEHSAKAVLARARDLREHSGAVGDAWLVGEISGDAVRELTSGVTASLRAVKGTRAEKARIRSDSLAILPPLARQVSPGDVKRAVQRLKHVTDPDGATQAAMEAYDNQSLTCVQVGDMSVLTAYLTHENAAAVMTVVDAYTRRIVDRDPAVVHDPACPLACPAPPPGEEKARWCSCGASAAAGVTSKDRWDHARAVGFAEMVTDRLDDGEVGSHHGIAPHVTLNVSLDELAAGIGGELVMPGRDEPVLVPPETVRRILCDAEITPVVVERVTADGASWTGKLAGLLATAARRVLYVGRAERTVSPRLRRAVERRDEHCVFPGCRANPRRCQVHHVHPWELGGSTDLDNLALLCVKHHHAVHEGGWTMSRTPGVHPHQTGCWSTAPPRPQP
jgi:hypothetical protein